MVNNRQELRQSSSVLEEEATVAPDYYIMGLNLACAEALKKCRQGRKSSNILSSSSSSNSSILSDSSDKASPDYNAININHSNKNHVVSVLQNE